MFRQWKRPGWVLGGLGVAALFASSLGAKTAVPGTVNYVEGQVALDGQQLSSKSVGSAQLERDQTLDTNQGKAEVLLTPGVFLRLGDHSELRMMSPDLTDTRVQLVQGEAMVEVTELFKDNSIRVLEDGSATKLNKNGLYEFSADNPPRVRVYDGKAEVTQGDQRVELKKGKETYLSASLHSQKFDRDERDPLYAWSNLRSEYLAEASVQSARTVLVDNGWGGPGWYWNPGWGMYSFLPGDGILYSPFGWGFYSPGFVYAAPIYGYYGGGHYYRGGHYYNPGVHSPSGNAFGSGRIGGGHVMGSGRPLGGFGGGRAVGGFSGGRSIGSAGGGRAMGGGFGRR